MHSNRWLRLISFVPAAVATVACGTSDSTSVDTPAATATVDDVAATNYEAGLAWVAADTVPIGLVPADVVISTGSTSGSEVASAAAAAAGHVFAPSGCVTATSSGDVATYILSNCAGPLGLTSVSGAVTATFTPGTAGLLIALSANNLKVNGATLNVQTQGTFTTKNATNTFVANTTSSGIGPNGFSTARSGTYTVTWTLASNCGTINGLFTDAAAGTSTKLDGVMVCRGECPMSGMAIRTFPNGGVTVTYNGSDTLSWQGSDGATGRVTVRCP